MLRRIFSLIILLVAVFCVCRCCHPKYNQPLLKTVAETGKVVKAIEDDQTLFLTTFSGGGTRAMAMGYYVVEELMKVHYKSYTVNNAQVANSLADEIDLASGVSGGSFVAAALPIYIDDWKAFEEVGVKRNIEGTLIKKLLMPWNWPYLLSPYYSRTNLASEFYDEKIFKSKTFGDLPNHPKLRINATFLAQGVHFIYTKEFFEYLSSDLSSYPIGYAAAASSAFPIGFTPITLKNYGETLADSILMKDKRVKYAKKNSKRNINKFVYYRMRKFMNDKSNEWVHNADGGLAGNTGIKVILDEWATNGIINKKLNDSKNPLKRLIIIVVNAGTLTDDESCKKESSPHIPSVMVYTMSTAMDILSDERLSRVKNKISELWQVVQSSKGPFSLGDTALSLLEKPYLIEINARNIDDDKLRTSFNKLPTSFYLKEEQLDIIKKSVDYLMRSNKEFSRLKKSITEHK